MGIDKHLILTLERSENRHWAVLGGARAMHTPREKIHFIRGHDNKDYDDDMKRIASEAEKDGFPYAHYFAKGLQNEAISQSASGVAQVWNFSRILRYIALGDETCLVTWDDRIVTLPFYIINKITELLQMRDEEFYLWQLRIRMGDSKIRENERICRFYPELVEDAEKALNLRDHNFDVFMKTLNDQWDLDYENFIKNHYRQSELFTSPHSYIDRYIQRNMIGYDESIVFSPKGASWLLRQAFDMKDLDHENEDPGIPYWDTVLCRRTCFDSWMGFDLGDEIAKCVNDGKGLYCSKQMGYGYVDDWLPMGSSVGWTNKSHDFFESYRVRSDEITYLDIP